MNAFKCDRCKEFSIGNPKLTLVSQQYDSFGSNKVRVELCKSCEELFRLWMECNYREYYEATFKGLSENTTEPKLEKMKEIKVIK